VNTTPNPDSLEPSEPALPLDLKAPGLDEAVAGAAPTGVVSADPVNTHADIAPSTVGGVPETQIPEPGTGFLAKVDMDIEQPLMRSAEEELNTNADVQRQSQPSSPETSPARDVRKDFARQSRRSFLVFGAAAVGGFSGFRWLQSSSTDGGVHWPLRKGLNASSAVQRAVLGDSAKVATHAKSEARELRRNGSEGVKKPLGPNDNQQTWMIEVQRNGIRMGALKLADLLDLPQVEQTVDHKCVEGWSQIVTWKGITMADVLAKAEELVEGKRAEHIGFATPDRGYYVTLERSAVKHPQTLLALSLNGEELTDEHGAPCRLAVPTRYGIKSIKRVGVINLSDTHASDYWGQRGYDLYAAF
jgi:Oxidoreductase molybdopterin binding domain